MSILSVENAEKMMRLLNVGLRGVTLLSKFVFIFFLAKFLDVSEVGLYGLFSAAIGYSLYVVGFEFYNFSTREIIGQSSSRWLVMVRDQFILYGLLYIVFLPLAFCFFYAGFLPWRYVIWFFLLTIFEHIAQEMNRLLIAMAEPLLASVVLFVRSGCWCLIVAVLMWWLPELRSLEVVLLAWLLGAAGACIIAALKLMSLKAASLTASVDWHWIGRGIKVAIPLLLATLAIRGIFTFDRYYMESVAGLDAVGAYVLYVGMATAVMSFLDAGVIVFFFPRMVALAKQQNYIGFKVVMRELAINVWVVTGFLVSACLLISHPLIDYIGKSLYVENIYMLYWLLLAMTLYCLSMIPHLGLYSYGKDKHILLSQIAGFAVFLFSSLWWSRFWGADSILVSMCLGFLVVCVWKFIACHFMFCRQENFGK